MSTYQSETYKLDQSAIAMMVALGRFMDTTDNPDANQKDIETARSEWLRTVANLMNSEGSLMMAAHAESLVTGELPTAESLQRLRGDVDRAQKNRGRKQAKAARREERRREECI